MVPVFIDRPGSPIPHPLPDTEWIRAQPGRHRFPRSHETRIELFEAGNVQRLGIIAIPDNGDDQAIQDAAQRLAAAYADLGPLRAAIEATGRKARDLNAPEAERVALKAQLDADLDRIYAEHGHHFADRADFDTWYPGTGVIRLR